MKKRKRIKNFSLISIHSKLLIREPSFFYLYIYGKYFFWHASALRGRFLGHGFGISSNISHVIPLFFVFTSGAHWSNVVKKERCNKNIHLFLTDLFDCFSSFYQFYLTCKFPHRSLVIRMAIIRDAFVLSFKSLIGVEMPISFNFLIGIYWYEQRS